MNLMTGLLFEGALSFVLTLIGPSKHIGSCGRKRLSEPHSGANLSFKIARIHKLSGFMEMNFLAQ